MKTRSAALLALVSSFLGSCVAHSSFFFSDVSDFSEYQSEATKVEKLPLDLASGERLWIDARFGHIEVRTSDESEPELVCEMTIKGRSPEEAERFLERFELEKEHGEHGLEVSVNGDPIRIETGRHGHRRVSTNLAPRVRIRAVVPPGTPLRAASSSGSIEAQGPLGPCELRTHYGNIEASDVEGDVELRSQTGSLELSRAHAEKMTLETGYGAIRLSSIEAGKLRAHSRSGSISAEGLGATGSVLETSYGNVTLRAVSGDLDVKTASGSIRLEGAVDGKTRLHSNYGNVTVAGLSGDLDSKTHNGVIEIKDVRGSVRARSGYGRIRVSGMLSGLQASAGTGTIQVRAEEGSRASSDWSIVSGYGTLRVALPAGFSAVLDARTRYGRILNELPVELLGSGRVSARKGSLKKTLNGKLGEGGAKLRLETKSGNIRIGKS